MATGLPDSSSRLVRFVKRFGIRAAIIAAGAGIAVASLQQTSFLPKLRPEAYYSEAYSFLFSSEDGSFARVQFLVSNAGLEGHGKAAVRAVVVSRDGRMTEDSETFESGQWGVQPEGATWS